VTKKISLKLITVKDDKARHNKETKDLRMRFGRVLDLLRKLLFAAGVLISGPCWDSLVRECFAEGIANPPTATVPDAAQNLERELLTLTNQHRIGQGLQPLAQDEALAQIARSHSTGMAQQGFISHHLPSGNLKERMNRAGYRHEIARENVANAPTVYMAQDALVASPGHERNILAKDVSRVGIGVVRRGPPDHEELYITEIFASPREEYQLAAVRDMVVSRVNELAYENGGEFVLPDPALEKLASLSVLSVDMPFKREQLQRLLADSAAELRNEGVPPLSQVGLDVQLVYNPKNLKVPKQVREGQARTFGTAVRQVVDRGNQPAFLVLTLIGHTSN